MLLVDDRAPFRSVAAAVVRMVPDWQVVGEAETGEEAVRQEEAVRPDVILMDIHLPGMTGIEATRLITDGRPGVAVVLVSTYAADDVPQEARTCGAVGYVRKDDLTPRLLRDLVRRWPPGPR